MGSFLPSNPNETKVKKHKAELSQAITVASVPASNAEKLDVMGGHSYQNSGAPRPDIGSSSLLQRENWVAMHQVQESRNSATDINISLPGG